MDFTSTDSFAAVKAPAAFSHSVNILMVDDHEPNLTALEVILDSPNYHLIKARSGYEAVEFARLHEFAVILMDVQMPGIDGFETARRIRALQSDDRTPLVFLTAIDRENAYVERGYEVGAVDYIVKPINPKILRPKIDFFAESHLSRKRLAALESEARFHLMADAAPAMVWISDRNRALSWINKTCLEFLGLQRGSNLAELWESALHPEDAERAQKLYYESFRSRLPFSQVYRMRHGGGEFRWVMDNGTPYYDNTGTFRGFLGVCIDIEEQKQAVRARDEFLSIASHELKTPVTSLKLQLQMLGRKLDRQTSGATDPSYLKNLAQVGTRQINQLVNLIDDMLDVSRISTGHLKFDMVEFDFGQIARETAESFTEQFRAAGVELTTAFEERLPVLCDRQRLEQVIGNLLTNALKYGQRNPVRLSLRRDGSNAVMSVEDRGMGIVKENISRIFERFERAVPASSVSGLGLGLYISRRIAAAHGGEIRVDSEPGKGSRFDLILPICSPAK